jgi:hypothetical protein
MLVPLQTDYPDLRRCHRLMQEIKKLGHRDGES